jgi:hypothetical protein
METIYFFGKNDRFNSYDGCDFKVMLGIIIPENGGKTSWGSNPGFYHQRRHDSSVLTNYTTLPDISSRIFLIWRE